MILCSHFPRGAEAIAAAIFGIISWGGSSILMSRSIQIDSFPGSAKNSSTSDSLHMCCRGSLSVSSVLRYSQSQSRTALSTP